VQAQGKRLRVWQSNVVQAKGDTVMATFEGNAVPSKVVHVPYTVEVHCMDCGKTIFPPAPISANRAGELMGQIDREGDENVWMKGINAFVKTSICDACDVDEEDWDD
jgi:hypothetical protein